MLGIVIIVGSLGVRASGRRSIHYRTSPNPQATDVDGPLFASFRGTSSQSGAMFQTKASLRSASRTIPESSFSGSPKFSLAVRSSVSAKSWSLSKRGSWRSISLSIYLALLASTPSATI